MLVEPLSLLLKSSEVASLLAVSEPTLSRWRSDGTGPRWVDLNGIPRYRREDVLEWVEERRQ